MTTKEILVKMLTASVGTSIFDSGGTPKFDENGKYVGSDHGYGRHVERNRGRDFEKELDSAVEFEVRDNKLEINLIHNVYHWLERRLELDTKLDVIFHGQFLKETDPNDDKHWLESMREFPEWLAANVSIDNCDVVKRQTRPERPRQPKKPLPTKTRSARRVANAKYMAKMAVYHAEMSVYNKAIAKYYAYKELIGRVGGIYGDGEPVVVNSYNEENMLSQDIQYVYFTWNENSRYGHRRSGEAYVVLQIHGGADIRGGYSKPHVFKIDHDDETAIFDQAKGTVYCTGKDHHPAALRLKEVQEARRLQLTLPGISVKYKEVDFEDCQASWDTDDSCNFRPNWSYLECPQIVGMPNLEDIDCVDLEAEIDEFEGEELEDGSVKPGDWRPGVVCVLDDKAYCPQCGAKLAAGSY